MSEKLKNLIQHIQLFPPIPWRNEVFKRPLKMHPFLAPLKLPDAKQFCR